MADLKLDNEFGAALSGAGSRPQFANLVKYRQKEEIVQKEFPTTLKLQTVAVQVGANPEEVDPAFRAEISSKGVYCNFRIANETYRTGTFKPDSDDSWAGEGDVQFMLASNSNLFIKVVMAGEPEATFGYARLSLNGLGEAEHFERTAEIKESEYVTPQDELLGYITISFKVTLNFVVSVRKLENQYDTKNIPSLMNVVSQDSKTLGHRMGAFQSALQILQNIVAELQRQGALGAVTCKQLSVILNQASSAQGVELFEDLLWDIAKLSFAEHIFAPSLTHFPAKPDSEGFAESRAIVGDMFDVASHPYSFALHLDLQDPIVLVAETEQDYLRWTAVLKIACDANSEANVEKLKKLVIPDYCKDPVHPDHPTAGWLKRRKSTKKTFSSDYVRRFFKLQCDAENHYTLFYSHEAGDDVRVMTKVPIVEGTKLLTPSMLPVPTPFALGITVQKVSDFSFASSSELVCTASLGSQKQRTRGIAPKETTEFNSTLLLPVQADLLAHAGESVTTVNIGWFGEEVALHPRDDAPAPKLTFSLTDGSSSSSSSAEPVARASVPFEQLPFGRAQELVLPLEGTAAAGAELTVSVTMRRLGQYKTAWPARKTRVLQNPNSVEREEDKWEGHCMVRAAPQGLEVYRVPQPGTASSSVDFSQPVAVIDYYSIEAITAINDSTLDVAVIVEAKLGPAGPDGGMSPISGVSPLGRGGSPLGRGGSPLGRGLSEMDMGGSERRIGSPSPSKSKERGAHLRRSSFGMVSQKGKSLSPTPTAGPGNKIIKQAPAHDYHILRISPCPAETLKDLMRERKWMFRDRSMLLYITHKLHDIKVEQESAAGTGPVSGDPKTKEKLAKASAETYRRIRTNMGEIIKTANWKHARGVGFTEEHIRMFFRLQRLSCYFAKLVESKACPLWALDADDVSADVSSGDVVANGTGGASPVVARSSESLRRFARADLDAVFSSQYVQSGTFGAEAQGIENSVKGVGHALRALHKRMDEVKLFRHDSAEAIEADSKLFFSEYFLRCIGELGAHVISDEVLQEVPIEVVVAFVCFLVKRDKAFHELLTEHALEPDRNAFLTTILSIDSMLRRLTKRTELEIVAQWPKDGDIEGDAGPYVASLLGDCSPDASGKLSTRAPEELMRLLEKYVQLIASQCQARGNLGAKIFEAMFSALSSYASNAAATIARLNHAPCAWNSVRYLSAILNDMARSGDLIDTLVRTNSQHLDGVPIDTAAINAGVHSSGVEVACLLADIALKQVDDVCAEFFQAEWYSDDDNAVMRRACKLLCRKMDELEGMIHAEPFFQVVVEAGVEKIAFRYVLGFIHRATDQSGGKMVSAEELDKMSADVDMMEQFLRKYGPTVLTSVYHLREVLVMMKERPEILQQAVFVDILRRHSGKEECVFRLLKLATAVRDDLRNFYVPAWLNKLKQKMSAIVAERAELEDEDGSRSGGAPAKGGAITFDVFEWAFGVQPDVPNSAYIYTYLMACLKSAQSSKPVQ